MSFNFLLRAVLWGVIGCSAVSMTACNSKPNNSDSGQNQQKERRGGPRLGSVPHGGPVIDKSGDGVLQELIKTEVPKFQQFVYKDKETGKEMKYNLYSPKNLDAAKKYPLVMFIADASTPGEDFEAPLSQGYGALVWTTDDWQKQHPCYVLVPQFSSVAVDDSYDHTPEGDIVVRMIKSLVQEKSIDSDRLYTTGQSMGGMLSMYYNVAYPDLFAASIFVDSHWDTSTFGELAKHKFIYFIAGNSGKAYPEIKPLEEAAERAGVNYTFAEWSARLPESRQSEIAATMLEKGAPVNIFMFEPGTVLPEDGKGSEHMYSFDYAYKIPSVREWLFKQHK